MTDLKQFPAERQMGEAEFNLPEGDIGETDCAAGYSEELVRCIVRSALATALTAPPAVAQQAEPVMCACKDRPASECDEQWGPNCDLGNNAKHARAATQQPSTAPQAAGATSEGLKLAEDARAALQLLNTRGDFYWRKVDRAMVQIIIAQSKQESSHE